jgi:predicted NAD/FAD-binding protein
MLNFPLQFFVRFFKNHGLLSVSDRPQWQVIEGGSSAYIAPLTAAFKDKIRLSCPVTRIDRDEHGVVIHSPAGIERFDKVVFACHSDQALQLLAAPSDPPPCPMPITKSCCTPTPACCPRANSRGPAGTIA